MKTKKIILIAVAVAVVVGGGIWFFTGSPAKHKVMYASATVSKGDISNSVTATGTIVPTSTSITGSIVPVAVTELEISPLLTVALAYITLCFAGDRKSVV